MRIFVHIRDKTYTVSVGAGQQSVEWLANVALLRFDRTGFDHISCRGFKYLDNMLSLSGTIESQMQPDSHCYLLLEGDQGFDDNLGDEPMDEDLANPQENEENMPLENDPGQDDAYNEQQGEGEPLKQPSAKHSAVQSQKQLPQQPGGDDPNAQQQAGDQQAENHPDDAQPPPGDPENNQHHDDDNEQQQAEQNPQEQEQQDAAPEAEPEQPPAEAS